MSRRIAFTSRFATGAMLLLWLVAGCNNSGNPAPTAPSVPSHSTPAPGSPSGGFPSATGPYTLSGVVADNGHPIANASVNAWVESGGAGYSYWYAHGPLQTDASGGYRLTSLPAGAQVWVQLSAGGYVQPCPASAIISGDLTLDIALVSRANVTASPMPSPPGFRSVSGTVVEMTALGSQPVAGAFVTAEAGVNPSFAPSELPAAYTYSDAAGRFALCGLPANAPVYLEADGVGNASAEVNVAPGQTSDIQITLPSSMSTTMALRSGNIATIH
jgi:hypothetical protein